MRFSVCEISDTLPFANLLVAPASRVMSLREPHLKMSKSHEDPRSRILLSDSDDDIRGKIKLALTDSVQGRLAYDPLSRPGVSNLLDILRHLHGSDLDPHQVAKSVDGLSMRAFKEHVSEEIISAIRGIRDRYHELLAQREFLERIAVEGAEKAQSNAAIMLNRVRQAIGID